ncbi:MAG: hypothetical protein PQJ60_04410 [Spirochaetales bacterium]|nr:hypothetical protein [Spirochaetales bacterium]
MNDLSGLILEGISGAGKTTLLRSLLCSERYLGRSGLSSVILSEHQTQRILERKQREFGLIKADNLTLLEGHVDYLESLEARLTQMEWCRKNQTKQKIPFILERFHLTHALHYDHMSWDDVAPLDRRLSFLNGKLCILTADRDELEERLFEGRDSNWNGYIRRFGNTRGEILEHFLGQQERFLNLGEKSSLPLLAINPSELTSAAGVDKVLDFMNCPAKGDA